MNKWIPLMLLAAAQFVMVLDSSVMNVAISQIVEDLDTTIEGVQLAITAYTLVMAAFMLIGAKLGDIRGAHRTFTIGMLVYGTGSLITALSPNLPVLLFGWSFVEGLGAALVMPAIAALAAVTYAGRDRALAFGVIGGISGAAIAVGPVIGGWVTTSYTWRYVFVAEVVVILLIMPFRGRMSTAPTRPGRLDVRGATLSATGLALVVIGVLQSGTWGWIQPNDPPTINGIDVTPLGFSPVPFVMLAGLGVLWLLADGIKRRAAVGEPVLIDLSILRIPQMQAGLSTLLMQQLILLGTFFVLPVYLQVVRGLDAFETGLQLLPLSGALLLFALAGPKLAARRSIRRVVQAGIVLLSAGALVIAGAVDPELSPGLFTAGLFVFGGGAGLLLSQLGNVIMSSVPAESMSEAGGLQGTAQNLGASLGTALIGSVLVAGLAGGFATNVSQNEALPKDVRDKVVAAAESGIPIVSVDVARTVVTDAGIPPDQADEVVEDYADAQLRALKSSLLIVSLIALLAFWPARRLPLGATQEASAERGG
jgi:MFS family permease